MPLAGFLIPGLKLETEIFRKGECPTSGFLSWSTAGQLCDCEQDPVPFQASISSLVLHGGSAGGLPLVPLAVKFHELLPCYKSPLNRATVCFHSSVFGEAKGQQIEAQGQVGSGPRIPV